MPWNKKESKENIFSIMTFPTTIISLRIEFRFYSFWHVICQSKCSFSLSSSIWKVTRIILKYISFWNYFFLELTKLCTAEGLFFQWKETDINICICFEYIQCLCKKFYEWSRWQITRQIRNYIIQFNSLWMAHILVMFIHVCSKGKK